MFTLLQNALFYEHTLPDVITAVLGVKLAPLSPHTWLQESLSRCAAELQCPAGRNLSANFLSLRAAGGAVGHGLI